MDNAEASIEARARLLEATINKLRARRHAALAEELVALHDIIRAIERDQEAWGGAFPQRLLTVVDDRIARWLRRARGARRPSPLLQAARHRWDELTSQLTLFAREGAYGDPPGPEPPTRAAWERELQQLWANRLKHPEPLTPAQLDILFDIPKPEHRAFRMVYWTYAPRAQSLESYRRELKKIDLTLFP